jgi:hypothetical protein
VFDNPVHIVGVPQRIHDHEWVNLCLEHFVLCSNIARNQPLPWLFLGTTSITFILIYALKFFRRIIWLGDLNYRLNLSYEMTHELISKQDWGALFEKDQVMWCPNTFNFLPTEFPADASTLIAEKRTREMMHIWWLGWRSYKLFPNI